MELEFQYDISLDEKYDYNSIFTSQSFIQRKDIYFKIILRIEKATLSVSW